MKEALNRLGIQYSDIDFGRAFGDLKTLKRYMKDYNPVLGIVRWYKVREEDGMIIRNVFRDSWGYISLYAKFEYEADKFCIESLHIEVCYVKPSKLINVEAGQWREVGE